MKLCQTGGYINSLITNLSTWWVGSNPLLSMLDDPVLLYGDKQILMFISPELEFNRHFYSYAQDLMLVGNKINPKRQQEDLNLQPLGCLHISLPILNYLFHFIIFCPVYPSCLSIFGRKKTKSFITTTFFNWN